VEHLEPKHAFEFLQANPDAVLIDCRSETEHLFVGHPVGAMHVPWSEAPNWDVNPNFVADVLKCAGTHVPVVLICRNGNRSLDAGHALEAAGFTRVYHVLHGFEGDLDEHHHRNTLTGWRYDELPWQQT
jgi:rhodanese-related sulfurtransferase